MKEQIRKLSTENLFLLTSDCKKVQACYLMNRELLQFWGDLATKADDEARRRLIVESQEESL